MNERTTKTAFKPNKAAHKNKYFLMPVLWSHEYIK
jgi:hypothetical protein